MFRTILLITIFLGVGNSTLAQRYSMLEMKQATERRARFGHGLNIGEPSGLHVSLYKFRDVCRFRKAVALKLHASQEGVLFSKIIAKQNAFWQNGGIRAGATVLWYLPFYPIDSRPYLGLGVEGGQRNLEGDIQIDTDATARFGLEWYVFGARITRHTNFGLAFFVEARYNHSISNSFNYLLPSVGFRFQYL